MIAAIACGPGPGDKFQIPQTPSAVWSKFAQRYDSLSSLALSGDLSIENGRAYDCSLQLLYAAPDSFAFLAEGTLGLDLIRGAIIGETGFWEIPREGISERIFPGVMISLPDENVAIDPNTLIRAVFYFRDLHDYQYEKRSGSKLIFVRPGADSGQIIELNRDSATPISQTFFAGRDTVKSDYSSWGSVPAGAVFPGRIDFFSTSSGAKITYWIKKSKYNPRIAPANFLPNL